jgi:hypothetical protein
MDANPKSQDRGFIKSHVDASVMTAAVDFEMVIPSFSSNCNADILVAAQCRFPSFSSNYNVDILVAAQCWLLRILLQFFCSNTNKIGLFAVYSYCDTKILGRNKGNHQLGHLLLLQQDR